MIKVIIADDHAVVRQAIGEMLTSHGKYYVAAQVESGEKMLEAVAREAVELVIIDLGMPGMGGIKAIEALRATGRSTPVLVLSAEDTGSQVRAAIKAGASGFVPKTAGIDELELAIDSVLHGKTYLSPQVTAAAMSAQQDEEQRANQLAALTEREFEIFKLLAEGLANREIAERLHISIRTVDTHRSNILKKLDLKNNAELVHLAVSCKVISV